MIPGHFYEGTIDYCAFEYDDGKGIKRLNADFMVRKITRLRIIDLHKLNTDNLYAYKYKL